MEWNRLVRQKNVWLRAKADCSTRGAQLWLCIWIREPVLITVATAHTVVVLCRSVVYTGSVTSSQTQQVTAFDLVKVLFTAPKAFPMLMARWV
jgi:hypothetical protein